MNGESQNSWYWVLWGVLIGLLVPAWLLAVYLLGTEPLCSEEDQSCFREWAGVGSGWVAFLVGALTIFYLRKQVADADRHQRIAFEIQLRRSVVLAESVARLANDARPMLRKPDGTVHSLEDSTGNYLKIANVLAEATIDAFETEIAAPKVMKGKIVASIILEGVAGNEQKAEAAPILVESYFGHIREQAESYLADVHKIIGPKRC